MPESSTAEVVRLIRDLNAAWPAGRFEDVGRCFDEEAVMVPPGGGEIIRGREVIVGSFRDFLATAKVQHFEMLDPKVSVFGGTACAVVPFQIRYEFQGQVYDEKGEEILVLMENARRWRIVWRTLVALPPESA
ncbi:MAG TPA: nuclear transport factor 2 family protein [Thermoanaerobaculia bacterium]|jgi:ketosteroid isomerase-like protein|nr:nuclear transport factor 2 family protein [Thermoanaerobaculia bacterium]